MRVRYYSINRPISVGTFPKTHRVLDIVNFDSKKFCPSVQQEAWGYIDYMRAIDEQDAYDYELVREYEQ